MSPVQRDPYSSTDNLDAIYKKMADMQKRLERLENQSIPTSPTYDSEGFPQDAVEGQHAVGGNDNLFWYYVNGEWRSAGSAAVVGAVGFTISSLQTINNNTVVDLFPGDGGDLYATTDPGITPSNGSMFTSIIEGDYFKWDPTVDRTVLTLKQDGFYMTQLAVGFNSTFFSATSYDYFFYNGPNGEVGILEGDSQGYVHNGFQPQTLYRFYGANAGTKLAWSFKQQSGNNWTASPAQTFFTSNTVRLTDLI